VISNRGESAAMAQDLLVGRIVYCPSEEEIPIIGSPDTLTARVPVRSN
jgi:hypothetical protein